MGFWPRQAIRLGLFEKNRERQYCINPVHSQLDSNPAKLSGQPEKPQETPEINMGVLLGHGSGRF